MDHQVEQLCARTLAGDLSAASALVSMYYESIFAWLYRLSGNPEDAADLTQKTFCKAWSALGSYQGRSSFSTWLHAIGHHVYIDWRRKKNPAELQAEEWWDRCAAESATPFEDAAERELAHRLYVLVERLDEETRRVVHLHYYQGLSLKETAQILNLPTSTVKYRLRQAVETLRHQMAEPNPALKLHPAVKGGDL